MEQERCQYLFDRYVCSKATVEEEREFMEMVIRPENKQILMEMLQRYMQGDFTSVVPSDAVEDKLRVLIACEQTAPQAVIVRAKRWLWAAASVVVLVTATYLFRHKQVPATSQAVIVVDAPAAKNGAVLTLGNGEVIQLDDAANGALTSQGKVAISKSSDVVTYKLVGKDSGAVTYNTLRTPRGRHMSIELADGSKVWLNAASSIRFPSVFKGRERHVDITGEVYFEVARMLMPDGKHKLPFTVTVGDMNIEVLGTHFNVNAYPDEPYVATTLLEGAVKVKQGNREAGLLPGQQSLLQRNEGQTLTINKHVNTAEITAWKDGYFHFESTTLTSALRQFSRWYDVDFIFEGREPNDKIFAIIKRSNNLSTVLKALQTTNSHFTIEKRSNAGTGEKLIVRMQ